ncbi:response regulator [Halopelagius fulvigenes]|uniref:Response regulator n=1 Tax=Halopelagius fulvigenes TaxID=1198324 RepID=A0ABD5TUH5_9EURY
MENGPSEAVILLVEDNLGDVRLIEEAFSDGNIANALHTVADGQAAFDFIYQRGEYEDAPRPDIVLLDLNLPKGDGEDVLHEIKHHSELNHVPVIVLTGVSEELIESRDLDHDADEDAVLKKPIDPGEFVKVIRSLQQFRLAVIKDNRLIILRR